jgi:hypothetical protein
MKMFVSGWIPIISRKMDPHKFMNKETNYQQANTGCFVSSHSDKVLQVYLWKYLITGNEIIYFANEIVRTIPLNHISLELSEIIPLVNRN